MTNTEENAPPITTVEPAGYLSQLLHVHTRFDLNLHPALIVILSTLPGVNWVTVEMRYRMSVYVGELFDMDAVRAALLDKVNEYIKQ